MTRDRHEALRSLFDALIDLPENQRAREADRLCPHDESLRREAIALCAKSDGSTAGVLDAPPPGLEDLLDSERPGDMIGPYRLVRRAGEGGFGVVFEAEQTEPITRRVAIKLVKPGMDSRQVLARFNAERQTLARLDHPGIARVLDAGATPRGRPYFLMDFIDGQPITAHCDARRLVIRERIGLFLQVCAAIEHAHQRGVIHRDIKPSNVLVVDEDGRPTVRVIDFGIARALNREDADVSRVTHDGQFVGTPAYMSPEQRAGDSAAIDTRTDVYALGVLLYELLTGQRPFAEAAPHRDESTPPDRPSTRFAARGEVASVAAAARGGEPAEVGRALRGELDWIVLRAIEREPDRRYPSVGELGADLRRLLNNEPVLARPPSRVYSARKFVARNRALAGAGAVSAAALIAASVVSVSFAVSEADQRRAAQAALADAERERRVADATSAFMTEGLIGAALPTELGREVKVRDAARFAAERPETFAGLSDAPEVEATVRVAIARTLRRLGEGETALSVETPAYEMRRTVLGEEHPDTLDARLGMGDTYASLRRHAEAIALFEEVHAALEQRHGAGDARALRALSRIGTTQMDMALDKPAEATLTRVIAGFDRLGAGYERDRYTATKALQNLYNNMGRYDEARALTLSMIDQVEPLFGAESAEMAATQSMLASIAERAGDHEGAVLHYGRAIDIRTALLGPDHGSLTEVYANRAVELFGLGRLEDSYRDAAEAARIASSAYGVDSFEAVLSASNASYIATAAGRFEDAERLGLLAYEHAPGTRIPRSHVAVNMAALYAAWERAEPGRGHAEKVTRFETVDDER